jgi:hypothetical protein
VSTGRRVNRLEFLETGRVPEEERQSGARTGTSPFPISMHGDGSP